MKEIYFEEIYFEEIYFEEIYFEEIYFEEIYLPQIVVGIIFFLNLLSLHAINEHGGVVIEPVRHGDDDDDADDGGGGDHDNILYIIQLKAKFISSS